MATTDHTTDYLSRELDKSGADHRDYLGRLIVDPDDPDDPLVVNEVDYLGRALQGG